MGHAVASVMSQAAAGVATDFSGFEPLRAQARANDPAALHSAIKQFESLFTQMLLKSMREASGGDGTDPMTGGEQGGFYRDMFDQQLSLSLANGRGLGLAEVLERQLSPHVPAAKAQPLGAASDAVQDKFVSQVLPHAQKAAAKLGVDPAAIVAQSALETGWGRKLPGDGSAAAGTSSASNNSSHNLFGIKAHGSQPAVRSQTVEYKDNVGHAETAAFRSYGSAGESFSDYVRLIGSAERYAGARNAGSDIARFAKGLQDGGYATDPAYADKIKAIADSPAFRERLQRIANSLGETSEIRDVPRTPGVEA